MIEEAAFNLLGISDVGIVWSSAVDEATCVCASPLDRSPDWAGWGYAHWEVNIPDGIYNREWGNRALASMAALWHRLAQGRLRFVQFILLPLRI